MGARVAFYLRVSTQDQNCEMQLRDLRVVAERHGWDVVATFEDRMSGAKDRRPQLDRLMKAVVRKEFDVVAAWALDRVGRGVEHLLRFVRELQAKGVEFYCHRQAIDTSTPAGKAMLGMLGVFAEFERDMIAERVRAGLRRARARGVRLGRERTAPDIERKVREMAPTLGIRPTARALRIGRGTVCRIIAREATR
jgi:DNA invertase Pin-like site-specific DNA recombinase